VHIPDGILSPPVLLGAGALSLGVLAVAARKVGRELDAERLPAMGATAAFIFAAQMVNFPLLGAATSGHLLGGAFAAIIFGFWPATLIMSTVLVLQALLFQDGGITALGMNILDMAIVAPLVGRLVYDALGRISVPVKGFVAGWTSAVAAAATAALGLGLSGVVSYALAFQALLYWHALIGIGEGLITAVLLPFAFRTHFGESGYAGGMRP